MVLSGNHRPARFATPVFSEPLHGGAMLARRVRLTVQLVGTRQVLPDGRLRRLRIARGDRLDESRVFGQGQLFGAGRADEGVVILGRPAEQGLEDGGEYRVAADTCNLPVKSH